MRPSARKKSQRGIKRSEAPCSEANNQRTTDAGAQSMSLAHYIEGGKLARERAGSDLGRPQACKLSIRILQTVGAGCAGGAMRARSRPSPTAPRANQNRKTIPAEYRKLFWRPLVLPKRPVDNESAELKLVRR